ncbi:dermonecrotic toxin domain-containing protein [Luteibacter sp. NPDC031894]|uniref:dermonecrotic toxin domain-containing protein n=1 Tax=Luteibacter sp. NPDC031894 TaxID=3390572 RepID=UPI003D002D89
MTHFCPTSRKRVARLLLAATAASPAVHAAGLPDASYYISGDDGAYDRVVERDGTLSRTTSPDVVAFATADDATAFATLWRQAYTTVVPDARLIAAAFVHDTLGIDGEAYVVAHFATAEDRSRGVPDRTQSLVDALMEAFPDHSRHAWFPLAADAVGGVMGGGEQSPGLVRLGDQLARASDVKDVFRTLGSFLWSRTGPGYVYNTLFAKGNVRETVGEDWRALDEAFGIYRVGGFTAEYRSHLTLSQLVESFGAPTAFAELPYVKEVKRKLDAYWQASQSSWPLLARYEFVRQARHAHEQGLLTDIEYERVMLGGAPRVPLTGPITLAQLGPSLPGADVDARRFDINGYAASNLVRFVARDGSEVMYIPGGDPAFVVAGSERELRQWVLQQARDRRKLDDLLLHFSTYAGQDGVFWTGVKHGLENVGNGQWQADAHAIDRTSAVIAGDVFEDMRKQSEERLRDDARMQMATAWEAWRTTINRGVAVASPLGFVPLFSMPVQVITGVASAGTGLDQELDGRTTDERKAGAEQVLTTAIYNLPIGALFGGMRKGDATKEGGIAFVPPKRVNGKVGYPLSPMTPPSWRTTTVNRLYRRLDGSIARWVAADVPGQTISRFPANGAARPDGMYVRDDELFVPWSNTGRVARVVASGSRYRFLFKNKAVGPIVERGSGDAWELATDAQAYVKGSVLAHLVPDRLTVDPRALHRAAQVLEQWGSSEAAVQAPGAADDPAP